MSLDLFSVTVVTALVVVVSGVVFLLETVARRDEGAGRIWALAFLAGMLTTISYMVWAMVPSTWWAVAVGNGAFVAATGCMWLGCRRFNGGRMLVPSVIVGAAVLAASIAVIASGPDGGDWAGALEMFAGILVFAVAGCVESLRGAMGSIRTSWGLAFVLGLQALYYLVRSVVLLAAGTESALFQNWFGTVSTSFLTVTLSIVALVVTSVLRAGRATLWGSQSTSDGADLHDGILAEESFSAVLADIDERAARRGELVGVIAVRIEDLDQISTAFGSEVARSVTDAWRRSVRRNAPSASPVGEDGPAGLTIAIVPTGVAEARREAATMYRALVEDLGGVAGGVIPIVGVGVGLTDIVGHDAAALLRAAREAAERAATSVESSVLVGDE